jgi:hypothetical protein
LVAGCAATDEVLVGALGLLPGELAEPVVPLALQPARTEPASKTAAPFNNVRKITPGSIRTSLRLVPNITIPLLAETRNGQADRSEGCSQAVGGTAVAPVGPVLLRQVDDRRIGCILLHRLDPVLGTGLGLVTLARGDDLAVGCL